MITFSVPTVLLTQLRREMGEAVQIPFSAWCRHWIHVRTCYCKAGCVLRPFILFYSFINSVYLSVCPSVCQIRALSQNAETYHRKFHHTVLSLVFLRQILRQNFDPVNLTGRGGRTCRHMTLSLTRTSVIKVIVIFYFHLKNQTRYSASLCSQDTRPNYLVCFRTS